MDKIKFIKSISSPKENLYGYEVWSDNNESHIMNCIGFVRDKYFLDMVDYFKSEGYEIEVRNEFVFS